MVEQDRRSGADRRARHQIKPDQTVGRREDDILDAIAPLQPQFQRQDIHQTWRNRLYEIMEAGTAHDLPSRLFDIFLISLITLNVLAVILESVAHLHSQWGHIFRVFEWISVSIFTLELFTRIWTSVEAPETKYKHPLWGRVRYLLTPAALIDLIAILPFYLSFLIAVDLRFMRVLRLLRVFKLTRYSTAMTILLNVLRQEAKAFGAALFVLLLLMVFSASMIYLFEHKAQPEVFSDIPNAMWWAVITLTTVGFGDAYPITPMGKLFGAAISIIGIGMVALPAGILASAFSEQLHIRREKYRDQVADALLDGVLTHSEADQLRKIQKDLGITVEEARNILHHSVKGRLHFYTHCPHCGENLQDKNKHT